MSSKSASFSKLRAAKHHQHHFLARFVLVSTLVAAAYVGYFWYNHLYASPVELYHRVWQATVDNYFDKSAVKNLTAFEHRYDNRIKTNDDAIKYANQMLSTLGDPFTALHSPTEMKMFAESQAEQFVGLGVSLQTVSLSPNTKYLAVVEVMPQSPALKAGIKPGDTIICIDGKESAGLTVPELKKIATKKLNQVTDVVVQRGKRKVRLQLVPSVINRSNVELLASDTEYAHIAVRDFLKKNTANKVMNALEKTAHRRGIILDMRDNPGGSVDECLKLASAFLKNGPLVTLNVRSGAAGHHREIYTLKPECIEVAVTDDNGKVVNVRKQPRLKPIAALRPMTVLINGGTASAAEMLTAALQDNHRAVVVGSRSYGKGIAQAGMPMANGTTLNLTCVRYYTPSGRFIGAGKGGLKPGEGIVPDEKVRNAPNGDAQLSRAVELLGDRT